MPMDSNTLHLSGHDYSRPTNTESASTSEDDRSQNQMKRRAREDGDNPARKKKRGTQQMDEASRVAIDTGESSRNAVDRDNVGDGENASANTAGENQVRKRTKCSPKAEFQATYKEEHQIGEGAFGSVYAGYRIKDHFPVAIKHVIKKHVLCKYVDETGHKIPTELAVMLHLKNQSNGSVGTSAAVSLLNWYNLRSKLVLVMERPVPCRDLFDYIVANKHLISETEAKVLTKQLVDGTKELLDKGVFHRDIKLENILIDSSTDVPRVRLIDFGLSCFFEEGKRYDTFYGTGNHIPPEFNRDCVYTAGPTTVWQVGVVTFEMVHTYAGFETKKFLKGRQKISKKLSADCQDFLRRCLNSDPVKRSTLAELQRHPWLAN